MKNISNSGQTLVSLLLISVIGITIAAGATTLVIINSQSALKFEQGTIAYSIAQSGIDNALLRLLRDPTYTGEVLSIGQGAADIKVSSNSGSYIATVSGQISNFVRKVQINAHYNTNQVLMIDSKKEIF